MPLIRHSLFLLLVSCGGVAVALPGLIISVTVGDYQIRAELAAPPEQRQRGLMGRAQLAEDEGILFVYNSDKPGLWYWMKDTPTPLYRAFIDKGYHIINAAEMAALDETTHIRPQLLAGMFLRLRKAGLPTMA